MRPNDNELTGPPADGPEAEPRKTSRKKERKA